MLSITIRVPQTGFNPLTKRKVRHVELSQLELFGIAEVTPAQIVRYARARCDCRLNSVNQEVYWYFGIIWAGFKHDRFGTTWSPTYCVSMLQ